MPVITTQQQERKPASSCKKKCKLSEDGQYCTGCFRSIEEIANRGKQLYLQQSN